MSDTRDRLSRLSAAWVTLDQEQRRGEGMTGDTADAYQYVMLDLERKINGPDGLKAQAAREEGLTP